MRVNVSLPDELAQRVDRARGDVPRSRWIRRLIENELAAPPEPPRPNPPSNFDRLQGVAPADKGKSKRMDRQARLNKAKGL